VDENDESILQSMMQSNIIDNRNPYRAVPPQIVGAGLGERVMTNMPSQTAPADVQQMADEFQRTAEKNELQGDPVSPPDEGAGPRPMSPQLVQAMAAALKPNLAQFQRPLTLGAKITRQANELMRREEEEPAETVDPDGTISKGIRRR
jgi:hypothetical protein